MKVELIKYKFDDNISYKYKKMNYCCDMMKKNGMILFDNKYCDYTYCCDKCENELYECNKDCKINKLLIEEEANFNTKPNFLLYSSETETSYDDSWENEYYLPINYCPFCGEKIQINIIKEINIDNEYKKLTEKRKRLHKERNYTDSIKKTKQLDCEIKKLDRKIQWFYDTTEESEE